MTDLDQRRLRAFFYTTSGERFYPWAPAASHQRIHLRDIAQVLGKINRWGGHTILPYSVAQHCVIVSSLVEDARFKAAALLHDASEAYMGGDFVSPVKRNIPDLVILECGLEQAIEERFGLPPFVLTASEIKDADLLALAWEFRDLTRAGRNGEPWPEPMSRFRDRLAGFPPLVPLEWQAASLLFFETAVSLGIKEIN